MSARTQYPTSFNEAEIKKVEAVRKKLGYSKYEFGRYCILKEVNQHVGNTSPETQKQIRSPNGFNRSTDQANSELDELDEPIETE